VVDLNIYERIDIFEGCYVQPIEVWGSDVRIVQAARMSTNKGFLGWEPEVEYTCDSCGYVRKTNNPVDERFSCPNDLHGHRILKYKLLHHGDAKLLRYLYEYRHMTPFEMAGIVIEVQAPIFVFREWHRHRTQSYNELSARYTELPDLFYVPSVERLKQSRQAQINKQSSGGQPFNDVEAENRQQMIVDAYQTARRTYKELLTMGVAREVARVVIPVAQISRMRASANLRNWLQFLTLRADPAAQWEIQQFAYAVAEIVEHFFPRTSELFQAARKAERR
jgi:thymidylate synthase (FAD)